MRDFGRLDVMIANAGIPAKAGGLDEKLEDWQRIVDIDFSGAYYCARTAGEIFRKQGSGNLIFTSSMSGHAVNFPQQQVSYHTISTPVTLNTTQLTYFRPVTMLAKQVLFNWLSPLLWSGLTLPVLIRSAQAILTPP